MRVGRDLLLVTTLALGVRLGLALVTGLDGPPVEDERGYHLLAAALVAGDGFALPLPGELVQAAGLDSVPALRAFRAPLLPLLGAPLVALGGGVAALRVLSLLAGTLCAPLLLIGLHRCVPPRAAVVAALGYAVWPPLVYLSVRALTEPLAMALLLGATLPLLRTGGARGTALAGVLAGLSVLARPAGLLPAAALALVCGGRRRGVVFVVSLIATLVPWTARNWVVLGRPLLTTNSGVTLVGGNSAAAASAKPPGKWVAPTAVYAGQADAPDLGMYGWTSLGEAASDARFAHDARDWVLGHPGAACGLAASKLVRLVDPDPRSAKEDAGWKALAGWLTLGPALLLGLVGLAKGWRLRGALAPYVALASGAAVTAVIFYGDTRMRTPADPLLLALAALGALALVTRLRPERRPHDLVE